MNQNTWIVGSGVVIIAIAVLLYMSGGSGVSSKEATNTLPPAEITIDDNFATTSAPVEITTDSQKPIMETKTNEVSRATLHTTMGDITLKFYSTDAPKTVENFLKLAKSGFYDGVKFHRVIKGFMNQTGDPLSKNDTEAARWGTGGPGYKFADEINASSAIYKKGYKHGVLAMANSGPNTNGSQFFIMAADYPLPPLYTIFGEVESGIDVVDKINATQTDGNDRPLTPVVIKSVDVK